jgi:hypothetical protein
MILAQRYAHPSAREGSRPLLYVAIVYMNFTSKSLLNRWGTPARTNSTVRNHRAVKRRSSHLASNWYYDNTRSSCYESALAPAVAPEYVLDGTRYIPECLYTAKTYFDSDDVYQFCLVGEQESMAADLKSRNCTGYPFVHLDDSYLERNVGVPLSVKQAIIRVNELVSNPENDFNTLGLGIHTCGLVATDEISALNGVLYGLANWHGVAVYGSIEDDRCCKCTFNGVGGVSEFGAVNESWNNSKLDPGTSCCNASAGTSGGGWKQNHIPCGSNNNKGSGGCPGPISKSIDVTFNLTGCNRYPIGARTGAVGASDGGTNYACEYCSQSTDVKAIIQSMVAQNPWSGGEAPYMPNFTIGTGQGGATWNVSVTLVGQSCSSNGTGVPPMSNFSDNIMGSGADAFIGLIKQHGGPTAEGVSNVVVGSTLKQY